MREGAVAALTRGWMSIGRRGAAAQLAGRLPSSVTVRVGMAAVAGVLVGVFTAGNAFYVNTATTIAIYYVLAAGYNVLFGHAGLLSLGHAALYGIGAYTSVLLGAHVAGIPWLVTVVAAAIVSGAAGLLMALPTARLRAEFLALATLALTIAVQEALNTWDYVGGANGVTDVPPASIAGHQLLGGTSGFYYLCLVVALATYLVGARMLRSRLGLSLHVLRDSPLAAESVGINPTVERATAFAVSGALAGIAGALMAALTLFLAPSQFGFLVMVQLLTMVLVGGAGSAIGPLVGSVFLVLVGQQAFGKLDPDYAQLCYTGVLLLLVLALRQGLTGAVASGWRRLTGRPLSDGRPRARAARRPGAAGPVAVPARTGPRPRQLQVCDVSLGFGGVRALTDVSLTVPSSSVVGLIGPNGAGKTSLVNVITGVVAPSTGEVTVDRRDLLGRSAYAVAAAGVVRTFQHPQLSPELTVRQNVMLGLARSGSASLPEQMLHLPRSVRDEAAARAAADQRLEQLAIDGYADDLAGECPYGVQRRIELARALVADPAFLLLDEIGAGLNDDERAAMVMLLRSLVSDDGPGVLLIDHNMDLVRGACDQLVVLDRGRLLTSGSVEHVLGDQRVLDVYLGRAPATIGNGQ